ncbi:MAG: hypothetical protein RR405_03480 [Clostridia bacterium]
MDKEELIANWGKLKDKTKAQILALADKEIKEEYFVPKIGEIYYTHSFDCIFNVMCYVHQFGDCDFNKLDIEIGNCFRTEKEAIFAGWCDYYTKRFETYVNRHSDKLDWNDPKQLKYYAFYNLDICYAYICMYKQQGTTYASSEQVLKDAIADIGEENFIKYVMKVEK